MNDQLKADIAQYLYQAERQGQDVDKATSHFDTDISLEEAYEIQDLLLNLMKEDGRSIFAPKLGLTSPGKMEQMNVDSPIYGYLFDSMLEENESKIDTNRFIHPKIEPEIAIVLKEAIEPHEAIEDIESLAKKIDYVLSAVEIIDSRYIDFNFTLGDVIADNASSQGAVFSDQKVPYGAIDLKAEKAVMKINGQVKAEGTGENVYHHPLNALLFLVKAYQERGKSLPPAVPIMTGGMTQAVEVKPGDQVEVTYDKLGRIAFEIQ